MDKINHTAPQTRSLDLSGERSVVDDSARTVELAFSSEAPYQRWYGIEILDHSSGSANMSRLNAGAPLLLGHGDARDQIGVVEKAWIDADRKGRAIVRFSRSPLGEEIFQDVKDGIRRLVSVGYSIEEHRLEGEANNLETYRMTKWTPFEVSIVPVPADATVGVGRDFNPAGLPGKPTEEAKMSDQEVKTNESQPTETRAASVTAGVDYAQQERQRMQEITAIARQFGVTEMGDKAIDNSMSIDAFRAQVLDHVGKSGAIRAAESPEIGMSGREVEQFSFCRAMLAALDPLHAAKIAPFEVECSRAAQDKRGDSRGKEREAAITIPVDVLSRGMMLDPAMAGSASRMLQGRRDLTVGAPTGGGHLVATELLGSSFIELLRNAMVLDRLGVTFLRDLNGNVAIPSQTGAATGYWVTEGNAPTESAQTVGQVALTPKTVGAFTDYSRRLLLQSSIDVEAFVRADLASIIGLAIQAAAINGTGTSGQPTGILNVSGIGAVIGGANGIAPTYAHMVDLESAVANANAEMGSLAYLTNTKVRGTLRKTQQFASTNGVPVWTSSPERGIGDVLGYSAVTTNAVPSDLTKGTSTGVASAIIFGNWADMVIGMWGGLDIMLDPYTGATSGTKRVVALQDVDVAIRHAASFAAMTDALTA